MAVRYKIKCPLCGGLTDLEHLTLKKDPKIIVAELTTGRHRPEKSAMANIRAKDITQDIKLFEYEKAGKNNPYVTKGILQDGEDIVEKAKSLIKKRYGEAKKTIQEL